jgi:adenylyltransferase/sulfurtransferase
MDKSQLNRYSRQIQLGEIGLQGQQTLLQSKVLIIGMGGLGSPVAAYLAAAGIGQLTLVDFDIVDLSNLQRQILHGTADIDKPKVESAVESLRAINPDISIEPINYSLEGDELLNAVNRADAVVDCCDNFATRFELNEACVKTLTPLISGGVIQFEGQVSVFDSRQADSPCYQCLYKPVREGEGESCSQVGVLASAPGIIGSIQATETLKLLLGLPTLRGRLLLMDAKSMEWRVIQLPKDPNCPICQA